MKHADAKIVLVTRPTRLDELVGRFNTVGQARFYIEHLGADFSDYEAEHETYTQAMASTVSQLKELAMVQVLERQYLPNFVFGKTDIVAALGQDGLVANTMKYLDGQPLIGINPDPQRWDGVLLPFGVGQAAGAAESAMSGIYPCSEVSLAMASLNNGQRMLAVNDLFIGHRSHVSARYEMTSGQQSESQSSSGVIVSTGLGASGWLRSCLKGAEGMARAFGFQHCLRVPDDFGWDSGRLYYTVREPFPSKASGAEMVFGSVTDKQPLVLTSLMAEGGVIFSDGIERDFLEFNSGTIATITLAPMKGLLVMP